MSAPLEYQGEPLSTLCTLCSAGQWMGPVQTFFRVCRIDQEVVCVLTTDACCMWPIPWMRVAKPVVITSFSPENCWLRAPNNWARSYHDWEMGEKQRIKDLLDHALPLQQTVQGAPPNQSGLSLSFVDEPLKITRTSSFAPSPEGKWDGVSSKTSSSSPSLSASLGSILRRLGLEAKMSCWYQSPHREDHDWYWVVTWVGPSISISWPKAGVMWLFAMENGSPTSSQSNHIQNYEW